MKAHLSGRVWNVPMKPIVVYPEYQRPEHCPVTVVTKIDTRRGEITVTTRWPKSVGMKP